MVEDRPRWERILTEEELAVGIHRVGLDSMLKQNMIFSIVSFSLKKLLFLLLTSAPTDNSDKSSVLLLLLFLLFQT
jgi:hypothetical protein